MKYDWRDGGNSVNCYYYYNTESGLVVGQVNNVTHTNIWVAKIYRSHNDEHYLGQFITLDFSKSAIQKYFDVESRTLLESDY